jgi:hypothetical protein
MTEWSLHRASDPGAASASADAEGGASAAPDERRRTPRHAPAREAQAELSMVLDVEVVDLSETGALLSTDRRLGIGHRLHIRTVLGREPFAAWLEVMRVEEVRRLALGRQKRYLVGGRFMSVDDANARTLKRFLMRPTPGTM